MTVHFHASVSGDAEFFRSSDAWRACADLVADESVAVGLESAAAELPSGVGTVGGCTVARCADPDCWVLDLYGYAD